MNMMMRRVTMKTGVVETVQRKMMNMLIDKRYWGGFLVS
jgi:hypothetical protein